MVSHHCRAFLWATWSELWPHCRKTCYSVTSWTTRSVCSQMDKGWCTPPQCTLTQWTSNKLSTPHLHFIISQKQSPHSGAYCKQNVYSGHYNWHWQNVYWYPNCFFLPFLLMVYSQLLWKLVLAFFFFTLRIRRQLTKCLRAPALRLSDWNQRKVHWNKCKINAGHQITKLGFLIASWLYRSNLYWGDEERWDFKFDGLTFLSEKNCCRSESFLCHESILAVTHWCLLTLPVLSLTVNKLSITHVQ